MHSIESTNNRKTMSTQDRSFVYGQLLNDLIRAVRDETAKVMRKLFARSVTECDARGQPEIVLEAAQLLLLEVPRWPMTKIRRLSTRFLTRTPALRDIVHATLDARISIYKECFGTSISAIPNFSINEFTHTLLINSARRFYTEVYVLGKDTNPAIARRNFNRCLFLVGEAVKDVIEQIVPTRQLINALPQHPTMNRLGVNTSCRSIQPMLAKQKSVRSRGSTVLPKSKHSDNKSSYLVNDTTLWLDKQSVNNEPHKRHIPLELRADESPPVSTTSPELRADESPPVSTTSPEQDAYVFATHLIENSKEKKREFPRTDDLQPKSPFPL